MTAVVSRVRGVFVDMDPRSLTAVSLVAMLALLPTMQAAPIGDPFPPCPSGSVYVPTAGCTDIPPSEDPNPYLPRACTSGFIVETSGTSQGTYQAPPSPVCVAPGVVLGPFAYAAQWGRVRVTGFQGMNNLLLYVGLVDIQGNNVGGGTYELGAGRLTPPFYVDPDVQMIGIFGTAGDSFWYAETHATPARACLPGEMSFSKPGADGGQLHNICRPLTDLDPCNGDSLYDPLYSRCTALPVS